MQPVENPSTGAWIGIAAASTLLLGGVAWWLLRDDEKKLTSDDVKALLEGQGDLKLGARVVNPTTFTRGI